MKLLCRDYYLIVTTMKLKLQNQRVLKQVDQFLKILRKTSNKDSFLSKVVSFQTHSFIRKSIDSFLCDKNIVLSPRTPGIRSKVTYTKANMQLKAAGLLKYVDLLARAGR